MTYPASSRTVPLSKEGRRITTRTMSPLWETAAIEHVYITQDSCGTYHAELFVDGEYVAYAGDLLVAQIKAKGAAL